MKVLLKEFGKKKKQKALKGLQELENAPWAPPVEERARSKDWGPGFVSLSHPHPRAATPKISPGSTPNHQQLHLLSLTLSLVDSAPY